MKNASRDNIDLQELRDKFESALKLLKSPREHSDGITMITEIDEVLKGSRNHSLEKMELLSQVSR